MKRQIWIDGVLREEWDPTTRLHTKWNAAGVQTSQVAFTSAENAQADADIAAAAAQSVIDTRKTEIRAVAADLATLRAQAVTLSGKVGTTWTQAEIRALGAGLVKLIDDVAKIGKEALKED